MYRSAVLEMLIRTAKTANIRLCGLWSVGGQMHPESDLLDIILCFPSITPTNNKILQMQRGKILV